MTQTTELEPTLPGAGGWEQGEPSALGFDVGALEGAVAYAADSEIEWPVEVGHMVGRNDPPPFNQPFGPTKPRGPAGGVVVRHGYVAAQWGEPDRVDMTFSATKSYLSTCVGLALDRGMIRSVYDRVDDYVDDGCDWFEGEHNGGITWRHLLQQTSEWSGTLFGIPDTVDHNRSVRQGEGTGAKKGEARELQAPGTFWEYNDVRVNLLGAAALQVWREPLPEVLRREVMDPIGATSTWEWHAYDNATVEIDGIAMPSVPGGAHWGGGLWISALDHARFGQLWLRRGDWGGQRLISESWVEAALTPCDVRDIYGYMWWLNSGRRTWPAASEAAFSASGAGGNVVAVVPEHDLVVVTRWAGDSAGVVNRVVEAVL